jgi:ubiquinone/menaquinone biosynthesis C-methylase UbiE
MRKFEFRKSYEDIEIAGKQYKVSLKDDDRKKYSKQLQKFYELVNAINSTDENKLTMDAAMQLEEQAKTIALETLDVLFGEGAGSELYAAAEEQTEELMPIIFSVAEIINERRQEKFGQYLKPKKKVK